MVSIEIVYNAKNKNQMLRIVTNDGSSISIPIKSKDSPETILKKINDILDIDNAEVNIIPTIKEIYPNLEKWISNKEPVPYKFPEIWCNCEKLYDTGTDKDKK